MHTALAVARRFPSTHARINASLLCCARGGQGEQGERETRRETRVKVVRKWTGERLGLSVANRGAAASGGGTWRVNASTSKWLAGTIIALNALAAPLGVRWYNPHVSRR